MHKKNYMKRLILLLVFVVSIQLVRAQEGTRQLMPNSSDRLYLAIGSSDFAEYGCAATSRLYIYLNAGDVMRFGMRKGTGWGWGTPQFRIRNHSD